MEPPVLLAGAAVVLLLLASVLALALRSRTNARRELAAALSAAQAETAELRRRLDALTEQLEHQTSSMIRVDDPAYVITDAGTPRLEPNIADRVVLSATVGEPLVKVVAFGHGMRRALSAGVAQPDLVRDAQGGTTGPQAASSRDEVRLAADAVRGPSHPGPAATRRRRVRAVELTRGFWFVAGAGAGIYVMVKARRAAEALTPGGFRDRMSGLNLGAHLFAEEVRAGMAEKETELRERLEWTLDGPSGWR